jgi:hypothetical protein
MILLESGPARTDRYYWTVWGLVFLAAAAWFAYDGAVRYRAQNIEQARDRLSLFTAARPELGEKPGPEEYAALLKSRISSREELHKLLGQPLSVREGAASPDTERFASIYGLVTVRVDPAGRVRSEQAEWQNWKWSKEQIRNQYFWAIIPALAAIYVLIRAYRASRLRAEIDEEGMTYGGARIAFADIVSIRDYNRKGWVDLYYRRGDQEKRLRIDNQKIAKFGEIIGLLCERRNIPNPVKEYAEAQRAGAADEPPAPGSEVEVNVNVDVKTGGQGEPGSES